MDDSLEVEIIRLFQPCVIQVFFGPQISESTKNSPGRVLGVPGNKHKPAGAFIPLTWSRESFQAFNSCCKSSWEEATVP